MRVMMNKDLFEPLIAFLDKKALQVDRKLFHLKLGFSKNKRPSSYPYLSGDSFRAIADHIHDETADLDPKRVKCGDTVFVGQWRLPQFFAAVHPHIAHQYVLICHNGDRPQIDRDVTKLLDDKVAHFFAQDVLEEHPKVTPIPIGLENKHYHVAGVTELFDKMRARIKARPPLRKNRIFFNFSVNTNPAERVAAREYFLKHPLMETAPKFLSPRRHNHLLMTYKFVASPPGNAIESCRTWEALYLGTVPITKDYASFKSFASTGLPMWVVSDWRELEHVSEEELERKYDEFMSQANWAPLFMDYWIELVNRRRTECRY
jgi:hypothetical protein